MTIGPDAAGIFDKAIAEHLDVVRQVQDQRGILEFIARAMTSALRAGARSCGVATAAALPTRNTWPRRLWAGFAASAAGCPPWP